MIKTCDQCGRRYARGPHIANAVWSARKYCSRSCAQTRHGGSGSFEHRVWRGMISRCEIPSATGYKRYGGRGIAVCDRWRNSFSAFFDDMGAAPSLKHSIERNRLDGNYEPDNCRWATRKEQHRNTRRSRVLEFQGESKTIVEWCEQLGLAYWRTHSRIHKLGWSTERALTEPPAPHSRS
jgi:hypothetical protein